MTDTAFKDAALVLLGHGTVMNAESRAPVYQHAAVLREAGRFSEVREAFWKQEPHIRDVLAAVTASRVFIVPLFVSEGYFSEAVIPRELDFKSTGSEPFSRVKHEGTRMLYYCRPVGMHDSMTRVLLARAREIVARFPFPCAPKPAETSLFIAGHGTEKNDRSRISVEEQAERIRAMELYRDVHAVFMEEEPRISRCYELAQARHIVMVPFFMSDGLHAREDIPVLLGEPEAKVRDRLAKGHSTWRNPTERKQKLVWYTSSVGTEPHLSDVIMELVHEAASCT